MVCDCQPRIHSFLDVADQRWIHIYELYICIHTYICIYVYTYLHMFIHKLTRTHTHMHTRWHTHTRTRTTHTHNTHTHNTHALSFAPSHSHARTQIHTHAHKCTNTPTPINTSTNARTNTPTNTHTNTNTQAHCVFAQGLPLNFHAQRSEFRELEVVVFFLFPTLDGAHMWCIPCPTQCMTRMPAPLTTLFSDATHQKQQGWKEKEDQIETRSIEKM